MDTNHLAALEALLFIHGEPVPLKKISVVLDISEDAARALVLEYKQRLADESRGLTLLEERDRIQLTTRPEHAKILEQFVRSELSEELTPAALETLAIVAYFGPISRVRIDYQRGVNSTFMLRSLLLRGLVERFPDPAHANSYLYAPSFELLRYLGTDAQANLPEFAKFRSLLERFESSDVVPAPASTENILQENLGSRGDEGTPEAPNT